MSDSAHVEYQVNDELSYMLAVANILEMAKSLGVDEVRSAKVATVTSELARNILKYAGQGKMRAGVQNVNGKEAFLVLAIDEGPGIKDIEVALSEHFSTGGTLGLGLSGVKRMVDELKVESSDLGTKVEVLMWI